jgi:hypothetical protein
MSIMQLRLLIDLINCLATCREGWVSVLVESFVCDLVDDFYIWSHAWDV